jgi:hypothetical protein
MSRLNQILAVSKTAKANANRAFTSAYQLLSKTALFNGLARTHQPVDDKDEVLPAESQRVQITVPKVIEDASASLKRLFDIVGAIDNTNLVAVADIKVGNTVLLPAVPVAHLLFLEKQLVDLRTFVTKFPVLDPTKEWTYDPANAYWTTTEVKTRSTRKVPKVVTKAPATDKHPAQTEMFFEDVTSGHWHTRHLSGAIPATAVAFLLDRIDEVAAAVKKAREEANMAEVRELNSSAIVDFIFQD